MILKVAFNQEDVIEQGDGYIVLQLYHYGPFATGPRLTTAHDNGDFKRFKGTMSGKTVYLGVRGGISVDN